MKPKLFNTILILVFLICLGFEITTDFESVKVRKNPGIFLASGDTISNRTAGTVTINSMLKVKGVISDTTTIPGNQWIVSPAYTLNTYRKTSATIQGAIDAIDSGTIMVYPGTYNERLTIKSKINIVASGVGRVVVTRTDDSCIVYGTGVTKFLMKGITLISIQANKDTISCIKLRRNYLDSTNAPSIIFDDVKLQSTFTTGSGDCTYGIISDSSSFAIRDSYMIVTGSGSSDDRACFKVKNGSVVNIYRNVLICSDGQPVDAIFNTVDSRVKLTYGYNQLTCTNGGSFNSGTTTTAKFYNNTSNCNFDGFNNLISSPNNIVDADFFLK